jgi:hypothetical protein
MRLPPCPTAGASAACRCRCFCSMSMPVLLQHADAARDPVRPTHPAAPRGRRRGGARSRGHDGPPGGPLRRAQAGCAPCLLGGTGRRRGRARVHAPNVTADPGGSRRAVPTSSSSSSSSSSTRGHLRALGCAAGPLRAAPAGNPKQFLSKLSAGRVAPPTPRQAAPARRRRTVRVDGPRGVGVPPARRRRTAREA